MMNKQYYSCIERPIIDTMAPNWSHDINYAISKAVLSGANGEYIWELTDKHDGVKPSLHKLDIFPISEENIENIVRTKLEEWRTEGHDIPMIYSNSITSIHGIEHVARVLLYAILIMSEKPEMNEYEKRLLTTAVVFHDCGRTNDFLDPYHGEKSAKRMLQIMKEDKETYDYTFKEKELLYTLVKYHCLDDFVGKAAIMENDNIEDKQLALSLYDMLKDADALDRFRLGFCCNGRSDGFNYRYLRLPESKRFALLAAMVFEKAEISGVGSSNEWSI